MQRFRTSFVSRSRISVVAAAALVAGLLAIPAAPASAAGPATHLEVTADPSVTAGGTVSFTVTALDGSEATADSYTGTVDVTVSDQQVDETAPQTYAFTAGDAGVANLDGILTLAGTRTITVTDQDTPSITGATTVDVTPGDASKLAFSVQPSDTFSQHTMDPVAVKILDAFGNKTTDTDTIQLTPSSGSLAAGSPTPAVNGEATFSDLKINTPGTAYTFEAADTSNEGVTHATSDSFDIMPHADIALTMSASPDGTVSHPAVAGTDETYTLTVSNAGPDLNTSYSVTAAIPSGTELVSAPGCSGTGPITCTGGSLNSGSSDTFTVKLHIDPDYAGSDSTEPLSFSATVGLTNPTQNPDNVITNDTATQTFDVVGRADLSNTLDAPAGSQIAGAGAGFDYTLKAKNDGPSDNFGYQSVFSLPTQVSFESFSTTSGGTCSEASQVVTCSNSSLTNGSTDTYTVHAKISPSKAATNAGTIATVSSTSTPDPNGANDDSPQTTLHVVTRANLSITKTAAAQLGAGNDLAYANNNVAQNRVTFTVKVKNADTSATGPSDAQAVTVTDTPPAGTSFVASESSTQCSLVSGVVTCTDAAALAPGGSRTYTIVVKVSDTLRGGETNNFTNTARVTSTTQDINGATYPKTATSGTIRVHTVPDAPTNPNASPGNGNAFYLWKQSLSSNGGETINNFTVSTTPSSPSSPITVGTTDQCGTGNSSLFCTNVPQLTNNTTYALSVTANNAVGSSTPLTASVKPTIDASAQQITTGQLSQHTGNSTLPSSTDKQISFQDFPSNTTGVGTILETSTGSNLFCAGPCFGQIVQTKLQDPSLPGIYTLTLLYDKTLIGGTGVKYGVYYAPNTTSTTGTLLKTCPATITQAVVPCSVVKLGNKGANPALKLIVYTKDADPTTGGKTLK